MIGKLRVTEMVAVSLSSVTTRGVETTCASEDEFRNERTALTPSAVRKPVLGIKPTEVLAATPPLPMLLINELTVLDPVVVPARLVVAPLGVVVAGVVVGPVVVGGVPGRAPGLRACPF